MPAERKWLGIGSAILLAASIWYFLVRQPQWSIGELAGRLPHADRMVARIDVDGLRRAGFLDRLAGKTGFEEGDYKQFVADTGVDYRRDLDAVLVSYSSTETHFFLTGRFDWRRLQEYAAKQGGKCSRGTCRMDSSTAGRRISFKRINATTLALASSSDSDAVRRLDSAGEALAGLPADPVWFLLPSSVLKAKQFLPPGTKTFATAVEDAERVTLSIGAENQRFRSTLDALFSNEHQATAAMRQLQGATALLNKMLSRDKLAPNPKNLTGVLSGGEFSTEGKRLKGTWPVESAFLESLGEGAQ